MKIKETEKRSCHQRHDSCHPGAKIKDNTESQEFSDLSEQQEALMVEVTIPNCYKQVIRSRDASKWHDAMDKEINVMMERKVWDLVDHPDNIKILENRWVYTIKYDENNKIVRYKARLVARGNTQLRGESFDEVFQEYKLELSKVKSLKLRCYSDSDFATNRDDRVSMGGFITFIDETPISSRTFKQKSVSLSTMEADLELFFMNSVASTLNRVTDMEFNNQISVLTPNNWNTWKHDMQVLLMHYGCWQFIIQTKPEQPDEEATYKEKLDLQLRKDRCYTLIYTNISSDLKNMITETTDGVTAWKILKDHFEPVTRARVIQLLDQFFGTKYQPGEDVGIFISRVKTAATRLQEAGHKLDDLYIGFQLIRWLPQEFQSTVQQIYRWKEEDFRVVKIEAELILEANRLQLMKQDLEKAENAYLSSFTSKKSKTLPSATAAAHGNPNGKNDYQKKSGKVFNCKTIKNVKQSIKTIGPCYVCNKYGHLKVNCKEKKSLQKSPSTVNETFNTEFDKGVWVIDTAATSHFCNDKSLFLDLKPIINMKMSLATEDKSYPVEGIGTLRFRVKYKGSFHEITLTDVLFNPKLRRNLLSGSRLESKGAHFVGTKDRKPSVLHLKPFGCLAYAGVPKQIKKKFDMRAKIGIMMGYAQRTKGYRIWLIDENKLVETINVRFDENKRGINFRQKVNSNLGYNLNLPDYYDDEDDSDRAKDSLTSRLVSKTSTETPSTSENQMYVPIIIA
ncbi:retrovirus-related Pol polyprotein from transposon TNT 1-94 [Trichonephila clavipes]|uniref:Retrovirus-related Pol polyprotein from transposon TNT 1-94 n=1 Tax=Trichonephila clavipes TaxID=2585209 RepID=A0A8X6VNP3_TRICX|nr:retrovirus-related Pol polyprotein from transposon TNT 1-94 [Trichonephila clavipes]